MPPGKEPPWSLSFSINLTIKMYSCGSTASVEWFSKKAMGVSMARRASSCDGGLGNECPLSVGWARGLMDGGLGERIGVVWYDCCVGWLTAESMPKGDSPTPSRGDSRVGIAIKECENGVLEVGRRLEDSS